MKYKAIVNIGKDIKAGDVFDGDLLNKKELFIKVGQIVAVPETKKGKKVNKDGE